MKWNRNENNKLLGFTSDPYLLSSGAKRPEGRPKINKVQVVYWQYICSWVYRIDNNVDFEHSKKFTHALDEKNNQSNTKSEAFDHCMY